MSNIIENLVEDVLFAQDMEEDGAQQATSYTSTFHYQYLEEIKRQVLTQIGRRAPSNLPECYESNSFWIKAPVHAFELEDDVVVDPLNWCKPDVFIWLPRYFNPRPTLKCPFCSSEHVNIKDYPHPRKVVDLDRCYYIVTSRHHCQSSLCGSMFLILLLMSNLLILDCCLHVETFNATHQKVVESMPEYLQNQFPCVLSHRNAMDKKLMSLMRACIPNGVCSLAFSKIVRELHCKRYHENMLSYFSRYRTVKTTTLNQLENVRDFPAFSENYGGYVPSSKWFGEMFLANFNKIREHLDKELMKIGARVLQIDHSFKVPGLLAQVNGQPVFIALVTIVNEFGQIRQQAFTFTKGHDDLKLLLKELNEGLEKMNLGPVELIYTDNVSADKPFLESIFPSLLRNVVRQARRNSFPLLTLPDSYISQTIDMRSVAITTFRNIIYQAEALSQNEVLLLALFYSLKMGFSVLNEMCRSSMWGWIVNGTWIFLQDQEKLPPFNWFGTTAEL